MICVSTVDGVEDFLEAASDGCFHVVTGVGIFILGS